ncbi:MAG: DNA adenine methylase [Planctomycetia bacterium]|nr:DNA adenine methylase [Planctomycetia bacterium]
MGIEVPETEGVKYAGSKLKLLLPILSIIKELDVQSVLDGFAGTTRVSQALAKCGYQVFANDLSFWSGIFGCCYLLNKKKASAYFPLIDHLNHLSPVDGWFTENYGGYSNNGSSIQSDGLKKPWQIHNTRKLDAIRAEIDRLALSTIERAVALTSLILALDAVDNTVGHYAAYLNHWSPRSFHLLQLNVPHVFPNDRDNYVFCGDIFEAIESFNFFHSFSNETSWLNRGKLNEDSLFNEIFSFGNRPFYSERKRIVNKSCSNKHFIDLAYYDPPYGSNNSKMPPSRIRYAAYYHLWQTVCLNDKPKLFGRAKRRADSSDCLAHSVFEDFRCNENGRFVVIDAIDRLIAQTPSRWILLSYSSSGRATATELNEVLQKHGRLIKILSIQYRKNVMAQMTSTKDWISNVDMPHQEFLFLLEKNGS